MMSRLSYIDELMDSSLFEINNIIGFAGAMINFFCKEYAVLEDFGSDKLIEIENILIKYGMITNRTKDSFTLTDLANFLADADFNIKTHREGFINNEEK